MTEPDSRSTIPPAAAAPFVVLLQQLHHEANLEAAAAATLTPDGARQAHGIATGLRRAARMLEATLGIPVGVAGAMAGSGR